MNRSGPKWSKIRGAFKAVKRSLFGRREKNYDLDSQWTLEPDFRFVYSAPLPSAIASNLSDKHDLTRRNERENTCAENRKNSGGSSRYFPRGSCAKNKEMKEKFLELTEEWLNENNSEEFNVCNAKGTNKFQLKSVSIQNVTSMTDCGKEDEINAPGLSVKNSKATKFTREESEDDSESSISGESYVDSSDDESRSAYDSASLASEEVSEEHSTSAKESSADDDSSDSWKSSDEEYETCLKKPSLPTIEENDREDDAKTVAVKFEKEENKMEATVEKRQSIKSIREMWIAKEKEAVLPLPSPRKTLSFSKSKNAVKSQPKTLNDDDKSEQKWGTISERIEVFKETSALEEVKAWYLEDENSLRRSMRKKCKKSPEKFSEMRSNVDRKSCLSNESDWTKDSNLETLAGTDASNKPPSSLVKRLSMKMQQKEEESRRVEEMIANHQPLVSNEESRTTCISLRSKVTDRKEISMDDPFIKHLLQVGYLDEKKKIDKDQKWEEEKEDSQDKFELRICNASADSSHVEPYKISNISNGEDSNKFEFLDDSITDPYFRDILVSTKISHEVKTKLKEEFFSIFNNSTTPKGVKKSMLDNLVVNFAQT